jgi:enoyl-CoA hydratase
MSTAGDPAPPAVTTQIDDHGVAAIHLDDGKANALSPRTIDQLDRALDTAEAGARVVLLSGRPGRFSAGFDLATMQEGPDAARRLVRDGAELALRIYEFPVPVVMVCTGHALAMGAILLMAGDFRVGTQGDYKIGLNEVSIGMPVPVFGTELARDRLSRRHFTRAVSHATIYDPQGAVEAGFLDEVAMAPDVHEVGMHRARQFAQTLDRQAFRATRVNARHATIRYVRDTLDADLAGFAITAG